jgi:hypothetical protein
MSRLDPYFPYWLIRVRSCVKSRLDPLPPLKPPTPSPGSGGDTHIAMLAGSTSGSPSAAGTWRKPRAGCSARASQAFTEAANAVLPDPAAVPAAACQPAL